jgi:hypothetical protein
MWEEDDKPFIWRAMSSHREALLYVIFVLFVNALVVSAMHCRSFLLEIQESSILQTDHPCEAVG